MTPPKTPKPRALPPRSKNRRSGKSEVPRGRPQVERREKRGARSRTEDRATPARSPARETRAPRTPASRQAPQAPQTAPEDADKLHLPVYRAASMPRSKPSCTACGLCCSYVAIEIDAPATVKQATQLLWYVYHEGVSLYVNEDEWMVQFDTTCIYLQPDYRCGVYETRPHICREFSEQDCEVNTGDDGKTFYTASEFLAHLKESRPRIHKFVQKNFAPPEEQARARLAPFEHRFQSVLSRRKALGI